MFKSNSGEPYAGKLHVRFLEEFISNCLIIREGENLLMHMIYTGFFSSVLQIVEHDMDKEIAKKNVHQLKEFNTGGWERIWNIQFK